jgi:spore coat protein CotH
MCPAFDKMYPLFFFKFSLNHFLIIASFQLGYDLLYHMGVRRPRGSLAMVYFNNISFGVHVTEEVIDAQFLVSRFGTSEGSFYKVLRHGWLEYEGDDPETYRNMTDHYEAKNEQSDFKDFARLVQVLNSSLDSDTFDEDIVKVLHVDQWLRALVVEIATGNLDGYNNGKNYFLFRKSKSSKFYYIPHDYDLTLGLPVSINVTTETNMYNWSPYPLVSRILASPKFRKHLEKMFCELLKDYGTGDTSTWLEKRISMMNEIAASASVFDKMHSADKGYSPAEVRMATTQKIFRIGAEKDEPIKWNQNAFFIQPILSFIQTQASSSCSILPQCPTE